MAYDEGLAQRIRELLEDDPDFQEKRMFGGVCFLIRGNMAGGIIGEELIIRVGKEAYPEALKRPHTRKFDITGKALAGWVMVSQEGHETDEGLSAWLEQGVRYARSLPPK